ncbi:MAG: hypothetical protein JST93_01835 [Acidobacteria bacterium]|nr:hypothetical protein [Acidobacteriota bacterium]
MNEFESVVYEVEGRAGLSFRMEKPRSWRVLEIPEEEAQFDNPEYMLALQVTMAPYGAVVHSVAARPAYGDGAVSQWMGWLCEKQGIAVEAVERVQVGDSPAMACMGVQDTEAGRMRMRVVFLEDGRRLFTVTSMAPEEIWGSVAPVFARMVDSFRLVHVHGGTAALEPGEEAKAETDEMAPTQARDVALAEDAGSLDPEHPMNARLRDNGVGLVPRVLSVNLEERYAVVGAGAVEAVFHVPLGWHVVDDGRRTLIFDAGGRIQINLDLRGIGGDGVHGLLEQIEREHEAQQPGIEHVHFHAVGFECLSFRGMVAGEEVLEQTFLVRQAEREGMALTARVTAKEEDMGMAMNVAEVVLLSWNAGNA